MHPWHSLKCVFLLATDLYYTSLVRSLTGVTIFNICGNITLIHVVRAHTLTVDQGQVFEGVEKLYKFCIAFLNAFPVYGAPDLYAFITNRLLYELELAANCNLTRLEGEALKGVFVFHSSISSTEGRWPLKYQ